MRVGWTRTAPSTADQQGGRLGDDMVQRGRIAKLIGSPANSATRPASSAERITETSCPDSAAIPSGLSTRRAIATAAGAELLRNIAQIDAAVGNTLQAMDRYAQSGGGYLRIATGSTACSTLLPGILRQLRRSLPGTEISVVTGNSPEIARKLAAGEIDVG